MHLEISALNFNPTITVSDSDGIEPEEIPKLSEIFGSKTSGKYAQIKFQKIFSWDHHWNFLKKVRCEISLNFWIKSVGFSGIFTKASVINFLLR